jgi:hypothetical protein
VPKQEVPLREGQLAVADFDGDGHLDIACRGELSFGDGARGFSEPVSLGLGEDSLAGLFVCDVDGDQDPDLVVVEELPFLLVNDGNAQFTLGSLPFDVAPSAQCLLPADVDGDGEFDLVRIAFPSALSIAENDGTGRFTLGETVSGGYGSAAVGDTDGDGRDELLISHLSGGMTLYGDDGGGLVGRSITDMTRPPCPNLIDMDGDGRAELVLGGAAGLVLDAGLPEIVVPSALGHRFLGGDLDGDGVRDLVQVDPTLVGRELRQPDGSFACADVIARGNFLMRAPGRYPEIVDAAEGDFDHDGVDDIAVAKFAYVVDPGVTVFFGWPDPPPRPDARAPLVVRSAGVHELVVTGDDFIEGEWTADVLHPLTAVAVRRESSRRLVVSLTVPEAAGANEIVRVELRAPDLRRLVVFAQVESLDVELQRGRAVDRDRAQGDALRLRGRIGANELISREGLLTEQYGLEFEVGEGAARRVFATGRLQPGRSSRVLRFQGARDASPRVRCRLDPRTGRFVLRVSRTDLEIGPGPLPVRVASGDVFSGDEAGSDTATAKTVTRRSVARRQVLRLR